MHNRFLEKNDNHLIFYWDTEGKADLNLTFQTIGYLVAKGLHGLFDKILIIPIKLGALYFIKSFFY